CDVAGSEYVQLIPRDLGDRLRAAGAEESASVVEHAVAAFTADLQRHARTACETGRMQHSWSPELVARSEACLANAAQVAQHVLRATELTPETIPSLVERTQQLPALAPCVDVAYLGALPVLPADPERRAAVVAARAELEIAISDLGVFELAAAKQRLDRIAGSPAHDEPTIAAGLLIARGWLATTDDHLEEAEKLVSDGYYAARAADDDDLATKALTKLLILGITHRLDPNKAKIWQRIAVADARRLETRAPWLAASILLCAARVADDAGAADDALAYLTQADRLIPPDDPGHVEVWMIEGAVKMWSGKVDEGVELYDRAIAAATKTLGPDHPRIAAMLIDSAASLLNTGRYQAAVVAAERAMEIASAAPDTGSGLLDLIRENLGAALIEVKRTDEARVLLEQARASYVQSVGEESPQVAHIDTNLAAIYLAAHEPARAIASLEAALATTEKLLGPDRVEVANVLQNLAAARRDAHDLRRALADARRCVAIYAATTNGSDPHRLALALGAAIANDLGDPRRALELTATALGFAEPPQDPASTASPQLERARALIALGRTDEARPLLASAREIYGNVGEPSKVGMVDNLMAKLR
ncbi:MAG: tetratricopeptide repeat protein, partial [Kofleriaceae bacterium]